MKSFKKLLILLLALSLSFALFACGGGDGDDEDEVCAEHTDVDGNGKCDDCDANMPNDSDEDLLLIQNGEAKFQVVLAADASFGVKSAATEHIKKALLDYDITVDVVTETADNIKDIEILIGNVTTRGEDYKFDRYSLGNDGYVFKVVGNKVIIHAGSDKTLANVIKTFAENIIGVGASTISDVKMTDEDTVHEIQNDYKVTSIKVGGEDMRGYTLAVDMTIPRFANAALTFQKQMYDKTGYWFKIVDPESATDKSILLKSIDKVYSDNSFTVQTSGTKLIVECAFVNMAERALTKFIEEKIDTAEGDVEFDGQVYKRDISFVTYEDFGAVGDGVAHDFRAIYETHKFANECGNVVKATPGNTYLIVNTKFRDNDIGEEAATVHSAIIKTDVIWTGAQFIIDDRDIDFLNSTSSTRDLYTKPIFDIVVDDEDKMVTVTDPEILKAITDKGLNPTTDNINLKLDGWDGDLMLVPYNDSHKVFRRRMYGGYMGESAHEVIIVDKNGNISSDTPVMFDYPSLNYIEVYKLDPSHAITIDGGDVKTLSCQTNATFISNGIRTYKEVYFQRNISISRPYTTVKNINYSIEGEITPDMQVNENGEVINMRTPYSGFFAIANTSDVTVKDCTLQARRCYVRPYGGTCGTYSLSIALSNNVVFDNVHQTNFWIKIADDYSSITPTTVEDPNAVPSMAKVTINGRSFQLHWGIGGSNYCKNTQYLNSTLSRYDAHAGLYNGKIINSTVNTVALTGNGDFCVEGSTIYSAEQDANNTIALRNDYGATWDGNIYIKDTKHYTYTSQVNSSIGYNGTYIIGHSHQNWYFGYMCAFPNVYVDNLDYYDIQTKEPLAPGHKIGLAAYVDGAPSAKIHLTTSHTSACIPIHDGNGDGYIDEMPMDTNRDGVIDAPIDIDGNGVAGETSFKYDEIAAATSDIRNGFWLTGNYTNLNVIKPPKEVKIINNDGVNGAGGYDIIITDTSGYNVSDGEWYNSDETYGGFYGDTKFIFGNGEEDYVIGTAGTGSNKNQFRFGSYTNER